MISKQNALARFAAVALCLILGVGLMSSCGRDSEDQETAPKMGALAPGGESRFLGELVNASFPETGAPSVAPLLRWDFSGSDVWSYDYEQQAHSSSNMAGFSGEGRPLGQTVTAKGSLLIKSQGDRTADLVLKDMKMSAVMATGGDGEPKTMEQTAPPFVLQGIEEDGSAPLGNSSQEAFFKTLFPLPPRELAVGESVYVPEQLPFNAMGSLLQVTGHSLITLAGYVEIDGRTCARLDTNIDISDLTVPEELEGDYSFSTRGKSIFFFDVEGCHFVSGTIALLQQFAIDAPMPKVNVPGEKHPDLPKRAGMSMVNDTLIRVSLEQ